MKLVDFERLNSKQKLIFLLIILILLVVIASTLMKLRFGNEVIDYKNKNVYSFIIESKQDKDRNTYWTLNNIIIDFLDSYQTVEKLDTSALIEYKYTGYSLEEYYKVLDSDYKKFLGKNKYMEISKNMMSKMVTKNENGYVLNTENIIKKIYKLNNYENAYICELNTVDKASSAYIGIILDADQGIYSIFYIE